MTYLELVNSVLIRMRENEVVSVQDTKYSKLIGTFINDVKHQVENAYEWNCLATSFQVKTLPGTYAYTLLDTNNRFKVIDVINDTSDYELQNKSLKELNRLYIASGNTQTGLPMYYGFNGEDINGNIIVNLYPIPDREVTIYFNLIMPQPKLTLDTDVLQVPYLPVELGAYALAIAERGEDGSVTSGDAYNLYRTTLSDHVAIESSRFVEDSFGAV